MDCEVCTDRLVELLYEELGGDETKSTLAHLAGCDACSSAYERISMGRELGSMLELVDPPVSVLDSVMAVAREKAAERRPAVEPGIESRATPPRPDQDDEDGVWSATLRWIGGFAMRPQFAMAMSLLLMVGLGMWYLPTLQQNDPASTHAIVDPAPGDEVGPSASLEPAAPLDLEADPRTGRILPREDPPARAPRTRPQPVAVAEVVTVAEVVEGDLAVDDDDTEGLDPATEGAVAGLNRGGPSPTEPRERAESIEEVLPDPRIAVLEQDLAPGQHSGLAASAPSAPSSTRALTQPPSLAYGASPTPAPTNEAAPQEAQAVTGSERYERGLRRYRQRDFRGAADDFESVIERPGRDTRRLIPSALHHLARSERSAQRCAAAVRSYERLLRQHPTYSGAPEAMVEAASCYERLGRLADARRWLERARSRPSVAARANRQLGAIARRERAQETARQAVPPADTAASSY